jgi:hypothetical protein
MGIFDPSTFLDATINEANSTVSTPCPEGEYAAIAGEPVIRQWTSKDGTKSGLALDINWEIDGGSYSAVKAAVGRDKVFVRQGIMLDTNAQGGLDTGKGMNVGLGKLREAVRLNKAGQPFSFRMLQGQVAKVSVKHRIDGEQIFADVKAVASLS